MRSPVRAKFRCLSITEHYDGRYSVKFGAVTEGHGNIAGDESFWKYTPSGTAGLIFNHRPEMESGAYYYIDMVPTEGRECTEPGVWRLEKTTFSESQASFEWTRSARRWNDGKYEDPSDAYKGELEMGVDNPGAIAALGEAGGQWEITFTFAEPSDG